MMVSRQGDLVVRRENSERGVDLWVEGAHILDFLPTAPGLHHIYFSSLVIQEETLKITKTPGA